MDLKDVRNLLDTFNDNYSEYYQIDRSREQIDQMEKDYKSGRLKLDLNDPKQLANAMRAYNIGMTDYGAEYSRSSSSPYSSPTEAMSLGNRDAITSTSSMQSYVKDRLGGSKGDRLRALEEMIPYEYNADYNKEGTYKPASIKGSGEGATEYTVKGNLKYNADKAMEVQDDLRLLYETRKTNPKLVEEALSYGETLHIDPIGRQKALMAGDEKSAIDFMNKNIKTRIAFDPENDYMYEKVNDKTYDKDFTAQEDLRQWTRPSGDIQSAADYVRNMQRYKNWVKSQK